MNNKITFKELKELTKPFQTEEVEIFNHTNNTIPQNGDIIELGISWWAIGDVTAEKAEQFANDLQKAIKFVKDFNNKQYILED